MLVLSLVLHLIFLTVKWESLEVFRVPKAEKGRTQPLAIDRVDSQSRFLLALKERIRRNREAEKRMRRQIVNNEDTGREAPPIHSRFLGEKNQTYEKQMVAKNIGAFQKKGGGTSPKAKLGGGGGQPKKVAAAGVGKRSLALSDLAPQGQDHQALAKLPGGGSMGPGQGSSQNNDYIEDVPLGDMTNLNTVQFKYFGFYSRIRGRLEQFWGHSLKEKAEKLVRSGKSLSAKENYITSLRIIMDPKGNILNVMVIGPSGQKDLDDAAVESFNKAGPFPNPPKGMLENGIVTIEWGFVVKS